MLDFLQEVPRSKNFLKKALEKPILFDDNLLHIGTICHCNESTNNLDETLKASTHITVKYDSFKTLGEYTFHTVE